MAEKKQRVEVNSYKDGVYVMASGRWVPIKAPESGFGRSEVIWKDGRIIAVDNGERISVSYTNKR